MELTTTNNCDLLQDVNPLIPNKNKTLKHKQCGIQCNCKRIIIILSTTITLSVILAILVAFDVISLFKTNKQSPTGLYGKWPSYGGNAKNQQITPPKYNTILNKTNIKNVSLICSYNTLKEYSFGFGSRFVGYITIDNNNRGYIADGSGYASCIDLINCEEIWSTNIAEVLGYNASDREAKIGMRHTATLFTDSKATHGIIFGAPNTGDPLEDCSCFAIALNINDGSLMWKTNLGERNQRIENYGCRVHGFMVDEHDHFAYGGMSFVDRLYAPEYAVFDNIVRGKMFQIDINDGQIVNKWYPIDIDLFNYSMNDTSNPYIYRQASIWNIPAIIDNYVIFGTGNLRSYPKYIEDCLIGNYSSFPIENAYYYDPCGNDRSLDNKYWRCLEKGIYTDSFVVLNKNTLEIVSAIPLQGVDCYDAPCVLQSAEWESCMKVQGIDSDLAAVAAYKSLKDGKLYGAAMQKSGQFYVFDIVSGHTIISKKIGPWSYGGGGQWGIAVDPINMIAVTTITGGWYQLYRYELADGTIVCNETGSAHAIDLNTGNIIWQMINPWGRFNDECNNDIFDDYVDLSVNQTAECQIDSNGNKMKTKQASETAANNVWIPSIDENEREYIRLIPPKLVSPVTISDDMAFIPSFTGHIYVHNLFTGQYIHTLQCPTIGDIISGGISIIENIVVFYCGDSTVVSMKL